jgi:hypothetical protein
VNDGDYYDREHRSKAEINAQAIVDEYWNERAGGGQSSEMPYLINDEEYKAATEIIYGTGREQREIRKTKLQPYVHPDVPEAKPVRDKVKDLVSAPESKKLPSASSCDRCATGICRAHMAPVKKQGTHCYLCKAELVDGNWWSHVCEVDCMHCHAKLNVGKYRHLTKRSLPNFLTVMQVIEKFYPDHVPTTVKGLLVRPKCAKSKPAPTPREEFDVKRLAPLSDEKTSDTLDRWGAVPLASKEARILPDAPYSNLGNYVYRIRSKNKVGACFVVADRVVTAAHVLCDDDMELSDDYWLCTPTHVVLLDRSTLVIDLNRDFASFATIYIKDGVKCSLTVDNIVRGMKLAKQTTVPGECTVYCWVEKDEQMSPNSQFVDGKPGSQKGDSQFSPAQYVGRTDDRLWFKSSTDDGWSGAPVVDNITRQVVGVHQGYGRYNGSRHNYAEAVLPHLNAKPTADGLTP